MKPADSSATMSAAPTGEAATYQRLRAHEFFEGDKIGLRLARQVNHREHGHLVAELPFVEQRAVALDVAGFLEPAYAPQAWWRRDTDPARQLHVGDAAIVLQLLEDLAVDGVESGRHERTPQVAGMAMNIHTAKHYFAKQYCALLTS